MMADTTIFAVAGTVPTVPYLTAGKLYEVIDEWDDRFTIRDDDGDQVTGWWHECLYLTGGDWTRVEAVKPVKAVEPDYRALSEMATLAIEEWRTSCERMSLALRECAKVFEEYTALHLAKGTEEGRAKAKANALMASMCRSVLANAPAARKED